MKCSELIELLGKKCRCGDDPEIKFESYEWTDNLEETRYLARSFDGVRRRNGTIVIQISR